MIKIVQAKLSDMKRGDEVTPECVKWSPDAPGSTIRGIFTHVGALPGGEGEAVFFENDEAKYLILVGADLRLKKDKLVAGQAYEFEYKGVVKSKVEGYSDRKVYRIYPLA